MIPPNEICASKSLDLLQNPNMKVVYNLSIKSYNSKYIKKTQSKPTNQPNRKTQTPQPKPKTVWKELQS